jgi:hypothetical protein
MILPFIPQPTYKVTDLERGMIYDMEPEDQFRSYLAFKQEYNKDVYGDPNISDEDANRFDQIEFINDVMKMIQDDLEMISFYNFLFATESNTIEEFKQNIVCHFTPEYIYLLNISGMEGQIKNAWQADVTKHFDFYKSLIKK